MFQQRAVFMSERVLGIDHPNTITEYVRTNLTYAVYRYRCVYTGITVNVLSKARVVSAYVFFLSKIVEMHVWWWLLIEYSMEMA